MAFDKKKLSKLAPEERIRRLKLMEESKKKEVDEIERLIKESMHELKIGKIAEDIAPEQRPVDISKLFQASGEGIERAAIKDNRILPGKGTSSYKAIAQTYEAYSQLKKLDKALSTYGSLTDEDKKRVGQIGERINFAEKYISEGEKAINLLNASRAALYKLKKEIGLE